MKHPIRLFHLLSIIERKHGLAELDPPCRSLLDIVTQREIAGIETTAEDLVGGRFCHGQRYIAKSNF